MLIYSSNGQGLSTSFLGYRKKALQHTVLVRDLRKRNSGHWLIACSSFARL